MLELSRTVRFCLNADGGFEGGRHNTYAAWPAPRGLARYFELVVTCRGEADSVTGYFINIRDIDTAVRKHVLPNMSDAAQRERSGGPVRLGPLLFEMCDALQPALGHTVFSLALRLTPYTSVLVRVPDMPRFVNYKQRYEFSAAHRLHVPGLSEAENRDVFGKCNNPAGHGHNYTLEVVVRVPVDEAGRSLDIADLDAAVDRHVVTPLDHKHLNHDVPAFADRNPSVENIAGVIWDMLAGNVPGAGDLTEISVWETGKTVCTYRGPETVEPAAD